MILKMTAEEYNGVIPEVLEPIKDLRVRVAMNAVKAKCDENTQKEVIENESTGSMRRIPASVHRIS